MKRLLPLVFALTASTSMAEIQISDGYVRATPPGAPATAAFMTIKNTDDQAVTVTGAQSGIARSTELHNVLEQDGVMKMRRVKGIEIPANGELTLKPGSFHVMFIGLNGPVKEGEEVMLMLNFSDGSMQHLNLPARKVMAGMAMKHNHAMGDMKKGMEMKEHKHQ